MASTADRIYVCPPWRTAWRASAGPNVPRGGYLLFVGTLEPRKNIGVLLDAYAMLLATRPRPCRRLVIAGRRSPERSAWLDPYRANRRSTGHVRRSRVRRLIPSARASTRAPGHCLAVARRGIRAARPRGDVGRRTGRGVEQRRAARSRRHAGHPSRSRCDQPTGGSAGVGYRRRYAWRALSGAAGLDRARAFTWARRPPRRSTTGVPGGRGAARTMRVAIDARELLGRRPAWAATLREFSHAWETLPDAAAHDFVLCAPDALTPPRSRAGRAPRLSPPDAEPGGSRRCCPGWFDARTPTSCSHRRYTARSVVTDADCGGHPRRVVCRPPGMVLGERGSAAPDAHTSVRAPRAAACSRSRISRSARSPLARRRPGHHRRGLPRCRRGGRRHASRSAAHLRPPTILLRRIALHASSHP